MNSECPECGQLVALKPDHTFRRHLGTGALSNASCPQSNQPAPQPTEDTDE